MPNRRKKAVNSLSLEQKVIRRAKRVGRPVAEWLALSDADREKLWNETLVKESAQRAEMTVEEWSKLSKNERIAARKKVTQQNRAAEDARRKKRKELMEKRRERARIRSRTKGLRNLTVDLSARCPQPDGSFIRALKWVIAEQKVEHSPGFRGMLDSVLVEFDKRYRPFIYNFLLRPINKGGLGFESHYVAIGATGFAYVPFRGEVSADDVFMDVWLKLFGDVSKQIARAKTGKGATGAPSLLDFDEARMHVGRGAFGCYLKYIARSVYYDRLRKDLVPEQDLFGNVMYRRDCHGKILTDKKGKKLPRLVPRCQLGDSDDYAVTENFKGAICLSEKPEERFQRSLKLGVACLAFVGVHERNAGSWFYRAAEELCQQKIPKSEVIMGCIARGEIRDRGSFDTAVNRFHAAMKKERSRILSVMDKMVHHPPKNAKRVLDEREVLQLEWQKLSEKLGKQRILEARARFMDAATRAN